ncbi:hypothetical protein [Legionella tunisiensis]|uniref:hypothetical protein n=1 Tax=Legionella tunisiensis TaxID=1034944 RepID=UPI00036F58AB|nr:hypothetical protein [Legionella tunisiensis]
MLAPEQRALLESYTNQMALALEVDYLHERTRKKELEVERDQARTSLLKSIFHDLCFPLKVVISTVKQLKK